MALLCTLPRKALSFIGTAKVHNCLRVLGVTRSKVAGQRMLTTVEYETIRTELMKRFGSYKETKKTIPALLEQHEAVKGFEEEFNEIECLLSHGGQDDAFRNECHDMLSDLGSRFQEYRLKAVLERAYNKGNDCYVDIVAGAGGEDAFDWVQMLYKMYSGWAKIQGFKSETVCTTQGDREQGFRSVTMRLIGSAVLGWMKAEAGVHRLVRISPFDPQHKRHTSFAQVIVYPHFQSSLSAKNFQVSESDIRLDTFRSSGAGGQSVQKTDSAVRLTHIPTGLVVACQNERSQHQNKATALNILKSKIFAVEQEREEKRRQESMVGNGDSSWGNQIKSVVLNPYQIVKDHRSKWEAGNVAGYLSGESPLSESMENNFDFQFNKYTP
jgi:peptide chain release factor 2